MKVGDKVQIMYGSTKMDGIIETLPADDPEHAIIRVLAGYPYRVYRSFRELEMVSGGSKNEEKKVTEI